MSFLVTKLVWGNGDESCGYVTKTWPQVEAYLQSLDPNLRAVTARVHVYTTTNWPRFEQASSNALPGLCVDARTREVAQIRKTA